MTRNPHLFSHLEMKNEGKVTFGHNDKGVARELGYITVAGFRMRNDSGVGFRSLNSNNDIMEWVKGLDINQDKNSYPAPNIDSSRKSDPSLNIDPSPDNDPTPNIDPSPDNVPNNDPSLDIDPGPYLGFARSLDCKKNAPNTYTDLECEPNTFPNPKCNEWHNCETINEDIQ
ncbi:circumsporozoite protein-like [Ricinus communis]|uniref:circumsporozoite protein-like n=1 Tax=Ricinus communis TaxID=3988 RepID=UPI00201B0C23|nr:circumsporozoite protein-like [Ricinus communis]